MLQPQQSVPSSSSTPDRIIVKPDIPVRSRGEEAVLRWTGDPTDRILREIFESSTKSSLEVSVKPLAISSSYLIDSGRPGVRRTISAGIHGNELCGPEAVARLLTQFVKGERTLESGSLTLLVANEQAVHANKRYLEANMNRLMGSGANEGTREAERAKALMPLFDGSHPALAHLREQRAVVLDLHSTSLPTPPFVWVEHFHLQHLPRLGIPNAVLHPRENIAPEYLQTVQSYCTENFVLCFTVECGQHVEDETFSNAEVAVERFLKFSGGDSQSCDRHPMERVAFFMGDRKNSEGFSFHQSFRSFDFLTRGQLIGTDKRGAVFMPFNGYILFPCPPERALIGKEEIYMVAQSFPQATIELLNRLDGASPS